MARKNIRLVVQPGNLPSSAVWDERKIRQVVYNLLQNAVKFTPDDGTTELTGVVAESDARMVYISVRDTGIGIQPKDLVRVFQDSEQVTDSLRAIHNGTGLGLAVRRRFVELHNGGIWAEGDGPGTGATFTFILPCLPQEVT